MITLGCENSRWLGRWWDAALGKIMQPRKDHTRFLGYWIKRTFQYITGAMITGAECAWPTFAPPLVKGSLFFHPHSTKSFRSRAFPRMGQISKSCAWDWINEDVLCPLCDITSGESWQITIGCSNGMSLIHHFWLATTLDFGISWLINGKIW